MTRAATTALLTVVLAATVLLSPWKRDLYVGDETKYGQVIREMHSTHRFLVPQLNGNPYSHKPPLHFWLIYALTCVTGMASLWPFVIPSILGYFALLLIVRWMGREFFDEDPGWLPAAIFGSFYLIWGLAQTARMDLEFTGLICLAVLWVFRLYRDGRGALALWAGGAVGLAILIKGPMAAGIVLLLVLFERFRGRRLPAAPYIPAILLAALIPLLWLVPALMQGGSEYARELIVKQNLDRAVGSWVHRAPPWFYIVRFPLTFFPWFMLVIAAMVAIFRRSHSDRDRQSLLFCMSWFLAVLIPFSLISGKLDIYMVPAMVPLALIAGNFVIRALADRWTRVAVIGNAVVIALIMTGCLVALRELPRLTEKTPEYASLGGAAVKAMLWSGSAVALAGIGFIVFARRRLFASTMALLAAAMFPLVLAAAALIPIANRFGSTAPLIEALERQKVPGNDIALFRSPYLWSRNMPSSFTAVHYIGSDEAVSERIATPPLIVAAQSDKVQQLGSGFIRQYVKIDQVQMKGKTFDVFRRR